MSRPILLGILLASFAVLGASVQQRLHVDDRIMADASRLTEQDRIVFDGRPTDVASLSPNLAVVKDERGLAAFDPIGRKVMGRISLDGGTSPLGLVSFGNSKVWTTTAKGLLVLVSFADPAKPIVETRVVLGGGFPCGIALDRSANRAYVALSTKNEVAVIDLKREEVESRIPVGIAPFALALDRKGARLFVTEQGGLPPIKGSTQAPSAGTPVAVDSRGLARSGSVAMVDLAKRSVVRRWNVGRQPQACVWDGDRERLYIACANDDTVVCLDPVQGVRRRLRVGVDLWGAMPTGLAQQGDCLYVTLAGANEVVELPLDRAGYPSRGRVAPTDWYPVALAAGPDGVLVANLKGLGSRGARRPIGEGRNSYDYVGTVTFPKFAIEEAREPEVRRAKMPPIRHVVYVIKENRTFDQVYGDLKGCDAEPKLCVFGESVTPNQHAIARQFVTLDNYYCSGVLSADGHSWATEGNVTPYLERSFGGFERSYTFGDDPLTYSGSGFVWDAFIDRGLSFRNYGEFDYTEPSGSLKGRALYLESLKPHARPPLSHNIGVKRVRDRSCKDSPGWNLDISDQMRMDRFEEEFQGFVKSGSLPNLVVLYLPQDHTGGPVSPRAHVADNDLAVGRLLDLLSHSPFWKETAVFVTEDDPQAGFDHVDGHRSGCLVAGGYVRRGEVISEFYTQASVLHTICDIFGIPPLNAKVAQAPSMRACFRETPDLSPFVKLPNQVPLDEAPPTASKYGSLLARMDLAKREVQTPDEMERLNRAIWISVKGSVPYPREWAGPHGKGLRERGLQAGMERGMVDHDD